MSEKCEMDEMNDDVLFEIFEFLNWIDILQARLTCKKFFDVIEHKYFSRLSNRNCLIKLHRCIQRKPQRNVNATATASFSSLLTGNLTLVSSRHFLYLKKDERIYTFLSHFKVVDFLNNLYSNYNDFELHNLGVKCESYFFNKRLFIFLTFSKIDYQAMLIFNGSHVCFHKRIAPTIPYQYEIMIKKKYPLLTFVSFCGHSLLLDHKRILVLSPCKILNELTIELYSAINGKKLMHFFVFRLPERSRFSVKNQMSFALQPVVSKEINNLWIFLYQHKRLLFVHELINCCFFVINTQHMLQSLKMAYIGATVDDKLYIISINFEQKITVWAVIDLICPVESLDMIDEETIKLTHPKSNKLIRIGPHLSIKFPIVVDVFDGEEVKKR